MKKFLKQKIHKIALESVIITVFCLLLCCCAYASSGYIVSLKKDAVMLLSEDTDAKYIGDTLYKVESPDEAYEIFGADNIEFCAPDEKMQLFDADYPENPSDTYFHLQWCHGSIKAEIAREKGLTGKGVKIAVIDSGVNKNHPDFEGVNFEEGYNCISGATDLKDVNDIFGHGTLVTGVIAACTDNEQGIAGVASDVTIIPIKITDTQTFDTSTVLAGFLKALETDCDIINMSLGGRITNSYTLSKFQSYIDRAEEKGIIVVAAAGNSGNGDNALNYPAAFSTVIGVGAVDSNHVVADFSQRNPGVYVCAPGVSVPTLHKNGGAASASGTSFASPIVAASLALIKQVCPEYNGNIMRTLLRNTVVDLGVGGYDTSYGHGMINLENMINQIKYRLPKCIMTQGKKNSRTRIHIHNNTSDLAEVNLIFTGNDSGEIQVEEKEFDSGVTNVVVPTGVSRAMLWQGNMMPFAKKMALK